MPKQKINKSREVGKEVSYHYHSSESVSAVIWEKQNKTKQKNCKSENGGY